MAHIGNVWPVHFRRDFNLNATNNRFGWANRYLAVASVLGTGFGPVLNGAQFLCDPQPQPRLDELAWQSPYKLLGLFFYRATLLCQIVKGLYFYKELSYEVSGHGIILVVSLEHNVPPIYPNFFSETNAHVVYWSPNWFDAQPFVSPAPRPWDWVDINGP